MVTIMWRPISLMQLD